MVRLLIRRPRREVYAELGISARTFFRLMASPWSRWNVGVAETFCALSGLDFWNLTLENNPTVRTAFARVRWLRRTQSVSSALDSLLKANGVPPTDEKRRNLAHALANLGN